jgi:uncharacterized membrane protein YfcA
MSADIFNLLPPLFESIVALMAVVTAGILRGFTGFGAALIIIPVVAYVYEPKFAVVLHALVEIPGILQLLPDGLRHCDRTTVGPMLIALLVAVPAGMYFLVSLDPDIMRIVMSVSVLAMVALLSTGWRYRGTASGRVSAIGGAIGGFFQGATGIGGPPIVALLMSRDETPATTRGNILIMMGSLITVSLPAQYFYGLFEPPVVILSLCLAPVYVLSTYTGTRLFRFSGGRHFRRGAMALLAATAIATLIGTLWRLL